VNNGAHGYLLKTAEPEELFHAVRCVVRGEAHLSSGLAAKLLHEFARRGKTVSDPAPSPPELSPRERDILTLIADGQNTAEIAATLALGEDIVKNHIHRLLEKLHLDDCAAAAEFLFREDAVRLPSDE
jgi:DNA-binding NarL/FixJ family response regulator